MYLETPAPSRESPCTEPTPGFGTDDSSSDTCRPLTSDSTVVGGRVGVSSDSDGVRDVQGEMQRWVVCALEPFFF